MTDEDVVFVVENGLEVEEFEQVLRRSGLSERRPIDDVPRLEQMLRGADLIVTARRGPELVGVARCVTDWAYCCYLSDLAVAASAQRLGIGKALIERVRAEVGPKVTVVLISAPAAVRFYEAIGMPRVPDCFVYRGER